MSVSSMKILRGVILATFAVFWTFGSSIFADTFTNRQTGAVLHGYATGRMENGNTIVQTLEEGLTRLNMGRWSVIASRKGRNNKVIVLTIDEALVLEIVTSALEQAIIQAVAEGPLFILLEIDTPGGSVDFTERICGAITHNNNCPIFSFIKGGEYGGALSAGAAMALACNRIYMADSTVIGAAAMIALYRNGPRDINDAFGTATAEKLSVAWQEYLVSLAEQNGRAGILARAMVDKDVEVAEVSEDGRRLFISPADKKPKQNIVRIWSKKGSLLTLTASEAVRCGIAERIVNSRKELLDVLKAAEAEIVINSDAQEAARTFRKVKLKFGRLRNDLDLKIKQIEQTRSMPKALKLLREIRNDYKSLLLLARRYPDLYLDVELLREQLDSAETFYEQAKALK